VSVPIDSDSDIIVARQKGRALAAELGFSPTDVVKIAMAISELARNVLSHASTGEIRLEALNCRNRRGIAITTSDRGPGIADVERAFAGRLLNIGRIGTGTPRRASPHGRIRDRIRRRPGHDGLGDEMVSTIDRASVEWATAKGVAPHCGGGDESCVRTALVLLARYRGALL